MATVQFQIQPIIVHLSRKQYSIIKWKSNSYVELVEEYLNFYILSNFMKN